MAELGETLFQCLIAQGITEDLFGGNSFNAFAVLQKV